jgi:hypothetical protein
MHNANHTAKQATSLHGKDKKVENFKVVQVTQNRIITISFSLSKESSYK